MTRATVCGDLLGLPGAARLVLGAGSGGGRLCGPGSSSRPYRSRPARSELAGAEFRCTGAHGEQARWRARDQGDWLWGDLLGLPGAAHLDLGTGAGWWPAGLAWCLVPAVPLTVRRE
ncbi:hypothetical protein [Streptomyces sp. NPDC057623]|uniref:hypothetical protein n=1 Tax=Streptomyces sp. NPDC057623 TaxID=3346187 RepID=UPI003690CBD0